MNHVNTDSFILEKLAEQVRHLPSSDIQKVEEGTHELLVRLVKKRHQKMKGQDMSSKRKDEILARLRGCTSREEGHAVISNALKTKKELEQLARHLDVFFFKNNKVEEIRHRIVEATVGAVLRSSAIQGRKVKM